MDALETRVASNVTSVGYNRKLPSGTNSPFFSRTYGALTKEQEEFCLHHLPARLGGITCLDPTGGQGRFVGGLAWRGADVWVGDINPVLPALAFLRSPQLVRRRDSLTTELESVARRLRTPREREGAPHYVDDWLGDGITGQLRAYATACGLEERRSPLSFGRGLWTATLRQRFAIGIALLAARRLASFRPTDNRTWTKPGGLLRVSAIAPAILQALEEWHDHVCELSAHIPEDGAAGSLNSSRMDAARDKFGHSPLANFVITSPPYANRLDYTRLWAPELAVLSAVWHADAQELRRLQIGTTVVTGRRDDTPDIRRLPAAVRKSLSAIRMDSESYATERYYYPFFRKYAVDLHKSLNHTASRLRQGGRIIYFVRDTVRKDVLFPTGVLAEQTLSQQLGFKVVSRERRIIKHHVGLLRRRAHSGLYGVGQQEWWLVLEKQD